MRKKLILETLEKELKSLNDSDNFSIEIIDSECDFSETIGFCNKKYLPDMVSNAYDIAVTKMSVYKMENTVLYIDQIDSNNKFVKQFKSFMI